MQDPESPWNSKIGACNSLLIIKINNLFFLHFIASKCYPSNGVFKCWETCIPSVHVVTVHVCNLKVFNQSQS